MKKLFTFAILISLLSISFSSALSDDSGVLNLNGNRNNAPGIQKKLNSSDNVEIQKQFKPQNNEVLGSLSEEKLKENETPSKTLTKKEIQQARLVQKKLVIEEFKESKLALKERKLENRIFVNGANMKFETPPVIKYGRTLIPLRAITESLGAEVSWDSETNTVTIIKDDIEVILTLGSNIILVNGEEKEIEISAESINNRTFVPLKFISEILGIDVEYDSETGEIDIIDLSDDVQITNL